jgi:hypothetical protein
MTGFAICPQRHPVAEMLEEEQMKAAAKGCTGG